MGKHEARLAEYRALREESHNVFATDIELLRASFTPRALAEHAGERAMDLSEIAMETVQRHRGLMIGAAAAVIAGGGALWLGRERVGAALDGLKDKWGSIANGGAELNEKDDTP